MSFGLPRATLAAVGIVAAAVGCDGAQPSAPPAASAGRPPASSPSVGDQGRSTTAPVATSAAAAPTAPEAVPSGGWQSVAPDKLCVTSGSITRLDAARFAVEAPTFRAVTAAPAEARARLRFTYLGQTTTTRALGSGAVRQQLGLKLRAQDPCNLVYVMWRITPDQKLVVSIKRNPGQSTSKECGNRGYANIAPTKTGPLPPLAPNSTHVLSAEVGTGTLVVKVDDVAVWEGALTAEALALDGPIGVRTDNVRIEADLAGPAGGALRPCGAATDDSE